MQHNHILAVAFFVLLLVNPVYAITEDDCKGGGGEWIVPSYEREPFCQCGPSSGGAPKMEWNGNQCILISDEKLCNLSDGQWNGTGCNCVMGEWINNYGCENIQYDKENNSYLPAFLFILFVFVLIVGLWRMTSKKSTKKFVLIFILMMLPYINLAHADLSIVEENVHKSSTLSVNCDDPYFFVNLQKGGLDELNRYFSLGLSKEEIASKNSQLFNIINTKYNGKICNLKDFISVVNSNISLGLTDKQIEQIMDLLNKPLPPDVIEEKVFGTKTMSSSSIPPYYLRPFGENDVAPYLVGKVAMVGLFVNDPNDKWTDTRRVDALDRFTKVKDWMNVNAPPYVNLNFIAVYDSRYATVKTDPNNCQANNYTCMCESWMEEAVTSLGYTDTDGDKTTVDEYLEYVINTLNVDHANLIFMLHSGGSLFMNEFERSYACGINYIEPKVALFFYAWPGCILGLCNEEGYEVYLHETLHNYGARDQYYQFWDDTGCGSDECTTTFNWGYTNGNCNHCNTSSTPSIMKNHLETTKLDYWNRGLVGWYDPDGDNVPDPLDNCQNTYGTWCNGCQKPTCSTCTYAVCPSSEKIWGEHPYCMYSDSTTSCGVMDCDLMDTECRDYSDKTRYCNGGGYCEYPTCDSYTNKPASTECGSDYWEYGCPWDSSAGADIGKRLHDFKCNGVGSCTDNINEWNVSENCSKYEYCYWDQNGVNEYNYDCKLGCLPTTEICNDGIDNDCDGYIDSADSDCCTPNWILNITWSACINNTQYQNYYDSNNCNKPETKPADLTQNCPLKPEEIVVYRDLPPSASMGEEFDVILDVDINESMKPTSYVLYEMIPMGFDMVNTGGMSYANSTRTLKLMVYESTYYGTHVEDRIITYRLRYATNHTGLFTGYARIMTDNHQTLGDNDLSGVIDNTPPAVFIDSPQNKTYDVKTIFLSAHSNETLKELRKSIDGNVSEIVCTRCTSFGYNATFENKYHTLAVYAVDYAGNVGNATVGFTVKYCEPNWILNSTWSVCVNDTRRKNYYDINNCNKTETKPKDITAPCNNTPPPIEVFRFLQPIAFVGDEFNVTLQVEVNESRKPKSYVLYETIPSGFEMINTNGMQYTLSTRTLKLMVFDSTYYNTYVEDRIITYTLKPSIPTTGSFIGYIRYNIQNYDTQGDDRVDVESE